ncbi:MAG: PAC2 family protein [Candidatus Woesearchaeota archaeon]
MWKVIETSKFNKRELNNSWLIEGLPGIGNVGKIAVDFMIEQLKPKTIYEFSSYSMPPYVYVKENNLIDMPKIELSYKVINNKSLLFLSGDFQPMEETSSFEFAETVINLFQKLRGSKIITLGGIGLSSIPKEPKVYCTGNDERFVREFMKDTNLDNKLFGLVGPIMGAAGLFLGIAKKKNIPAIALLAETFGHPMYIGMKGSREIVRVLNKKLDLKINISKFDKQIEDFEKQILSKFSMEVQKPKTKPGELNYIG